MEKKPGKSPAYPAEYAPVEQLVNDTQKTVQQFEARMENLPPDQGPAPRLTPPGYLSPRQPGNRHATQTKLQTDKQAFLTERYNQGEQLTREADPSLRSAMREETRNRLFPNPYRNMSAEERAKQQGESRDLEQSQDFMDARRLRDQDKENQPDTRDLDQSQKYMMDLLAKQREQPVEEKTQPETPTASVSMRFMQTLRHPSGPSKENGPSTPTKTRDVDQDRD